MIQASYGISKLSQGALQETRHNIQFSIFQFNHFKVRCSIALRKLTLLCSNQQHPSLDGGWGRGDVRKVGVNGEEEPGVLGKILDPNSTNEAWFVL